MKIIGLQGIKVPQLKDHLDLYMDKINREMESKKQQKGEKFISTIFPPVHVNCKIDTQTGLDLLDWALSN